MTVPESSLNIETLSHRIYSIRSLNVILDADLAELYGVTTKRLNEQVAQPGPISTRLHVSTGRG